MTCADNSATFPGLYETAWTDFAFAISTRRLFIVMPGADARTLIKVSYEVRAVLFYFYGSAGGFHLLLYCSSFLFGDAFLNRFRGSFYQVLGLLEP